MRPGKLVVMLEAKPNPDYSGDERNWRGKVRIPIRRVLAEDMVDAARTCMKFIEENELGGGNWTGGDVYDEDMKPVARVSYNGRVWEPGRYPTKEIDPRAWDKAREMEFKSRRSSEFRTKEELEKYLKEHPGADRSRHKVRQTVWDSQSPEQQRKWKSQDRQDAKERMEKNRWAATGKIPPKGKYTVRLSGSPNADYTSPGERLRTLDLEPFYVVKDFDEASDVRELKAMARRLAAEVDLSRVLGPKYRRVDRLSKHPWEVFEVDGMDPSRVNREVKRTLDEERVDYRSVEVRVDGREDHLLRSDVYVIIERW